MNQPTPHLDDAGATVAYVDTPLPEPGESRPIAPGVHWVRMPLPFALDHINLWLLEDGDGWTLVDTGVARDEVRAAWSALFAGTMGGRPLRRIVVTHFHPDHFGLAGWLHEQTGAPVWMTRAEWLTGNLIFHDAEGRFARRMVDFFRCHGLDRDRLEGIAARGNHYRRILSDPPPAFRRIADGDELEIGGRRWRVVVGEGHAPEHACLHCEELGVLISGDQVLPRISPNVSLVAADPDADPLGEYLATLERLRAVPRSSLVLPSHDRPFHGLHPRLDALAAHHDERLEVLETALGDGAASAAELMPALFRRRLDIHQSTFAMGETLSHLARLAACGRVAAETGTDGIVRFRRARA